MAHAETDDLIETFKRALDDMLARVFVSAVGRPAPVIAVAYSGGLDSSVLLHLAQAYAVKHGISLFAFHVHHGLSPNADAWLAHCEGVCASRQIAFAARKVHVAKDDGRGLEAAARVARYGALGVLGRQHGVKLLLTAHHLDDQAETVLLQMLRGAGLAGISGMEALSTAPELLGDGNVAIGRPLLPVRRVELSAWIADAGFSFVEDESNRNVHHPRNALRNAVLPLLATHFPAYAACLARGAQHAQAAQRLLDELALQDCAACQDGEGLDAERVGRLSDDRVANLLRHWLTRQGLRPPSTAWLEEACMQLLGAREDAQACVKWADREVRRYRNRIVIMPAQVHTYAEPIVFQWQGEPSIRMPAFNGTLYFDKREQGLEAEWLRNQRLRLQYRTGGEQLKLALNRPGKTLKEWYQERAIPAWERPTLPLLYADTALLFAAAIGQDCRLPSAAPGVRLRWVAD